MTITRVFQDGVEFFTVIETGESGLSESGVSRLVGVSQKAINNLLGHNPVRTKRYPECLERLRDKGFHLELPGENNSKLVKAEVVAAVVEYYAFESRNKTAEALYAYRKFATMGIEAWIQTITGWQRPPAVPEIITETRLNNDDINLLIGEKRPSSIYRLYLHLHSIGQQGQRPTVTQICDRLSITRATYHKSVRRLYDLGLLPDWLEIEKRNYAERFVRDWLQSELGGETEVPTPDGPIDLLTDKNIIEVKAIEQWKEAIGHIITKSANYPELHAGILLFGKSDRNFDHITKRCEALDITVGFRAIQYEVNPLTNATEISFQP
jgi:hypothetical protein